MAKITPMAPDSAGFKVLVRLYHLGGKAPVSQLIESLWTEFRSTERFERLVTVPLLERGLVKRAVKRKGDVLSITLEGSLMVRRYQASLPAPKAQPVPATGALDVKKFLSWGQSRPGALDYREMPSLMGGERVPFRRSKEETEA